MNTNSLSYTPFFQKCLATLKARTEAAQTGNRDLWRNLHKECNKLRSQLPEIYDLAWRQAIQEYEPLPFPNVPEEPNF